MTAHTAHSAQCWDVPSDNLQLLELHQCRHIIATSAKFGAYHWGKIYKCTEDLCTYLERGIPEGVDVHWHHPHLASIIALQVNHGTNAPSVAHIDPQPQRLLVQHVQQIYLKHIR